MIKQGQVESGDMSGDEARTGKETGVEAIGRTPDGNRDGCGDGN